MQRFDSINCVAAPTSPRHCQIAEAHTLPAKENTVNETELSDGDLELASQLSIIGNSNKKRDVVPLDLEDPQRAANEKLFLNLLHKIGIPQKLHEQVLN